MGFGVQGPWGFGFRVLGVSRFRLGVFSWGLGLGLRVSKSCFALHHLVWLLQPGFRLWALNPKPLNP